MAFLQPDTSHSVAADAGRQAPEALQLPVGVHLKLTGVLP